MERKAKWIVAAAGSLALIGAGAGAAVAGVGGDDDGAETAITGVALEKASAAALAHTGEGTVSETEVGDEEGYYEVEVTLDDGSQTDVHLDKDFRVLGEERDGAGNADEEEGDG